MDNYAEYITLTFAVIAALQIPAQLIVNFTETPKDDEALAKAYRVVEIIAGIWSFKAKL